MTGQIEVAQSRIDDLCRRYDIHKLSLFGSVLSGRFSVASDVDILVEFRPGTRLGFFRLAEIEEKLRQLLEGRKVDLRTPMDLSRHFRDQVRRDALVVYAEP